MEESPPILSVFCLNIPCDCDREMSTSLSLSLSPSLSLSLSLVWTSQGQSLVPCCRIVDLVTNCSYKTPTYGHWSTGPQSCSLWREEGRDPQHPCRKCDLGMVLEEMNRKCWDGNTVARATAHSEAWETWKAETGMKWEPLPVCTIQRADWASTGGELKQEFRGTDPELCHQNGGGELPPPRSSGNNQ